MNWLVDFSFTRHGPEDAKAAGYVGGISYLSRSPEKNWDGVYVDGSCERPGEVQAWLDAGLAVGLVWETTADRATQGYAAGFADAQAANAEADALGAPARVAIFHAVDENIGYGAVADYFRGVIEAKGRPAGAYGSQAVVEGFLDAGGSYGWQVATWGNRSPRAHIFQEPNVDAGLPAADANSIQIPAWGGWSTEEDDMYTDADRARDEKVAAVVAASTDADPATPSLLEAIADVVNSTKALAGMVATEVLPFFAAFDPQFPERKDVDKGREALVALIKGKAGE